MLANTENVTQIMWPSDRLPALRNTPVRARLLDIVRGLYGDDTMDFDFDMLICKAPHSATATPAHQDQASDIELLNGVEDQHSPLYLHSRTRSTASLLALAYWRYNSGISAAVHDELLDALLSTHPVMTISAGSFVNWSPPGVLA